MTRVEDIITNFELEVNDMTELSTSEELLILNRVYKRVCLSPYEFLKVNATGTILSDSTSFYITLPDDFRYLSSNGDFSEQNMMYDDNVKPRVIFVGPNFARYKVINFSDRVQYRNQTGYCYLDLAGNKIRFCYPPTDTTYSFDYIKTPPTLTTADAPLFPEDFDSVIVYGMAQENEILQRSDKARSYKDDYEIKYQQAVRDLKLYNAQMVNY